MYLFILGSIIDRPLVRVCRVSGHRAISKAETVKGWEPSSLPVLAVEVQGQALSLSFQRQFSDETFELALSDGSLKEDQW